MIPEPSRDGAAFRHYAVHQTRPVREAGINLVASFRRRAENAEILYLKQELHLNAAGHDELARVLSEYLAASSH